MKYFGILLVILVLQSFYYYTEFERFKDCLRDNIAFEKCEELIYPSRQKFSSLWEDLF